MTINKTMNIEFHSLKIFFRSMRLVDIREGNIVSHA